MWPADGGEPDPIEHTDDNTARDPNGIPSARSRSPQCEPGITRNGPLSRAHIVLHHMPASTCRGPLARCRGTVSAALNTSRCRTLAESAGRADRRLMVEPRRKRRHAKLPEGKQNIRIGMSPVAAGAAVSGVPIRRLSEAVGVYAAPDQDVYDVDIWLNGVHAVATCSALGKVGPDSRLTASGQGQDRTVDLPLLSGQAGRDERGPLA